jgi:hypothetical protein
MRAAYGVNRQNRKWGAMSSHDMEGGHVVEVCCSIVAVVRLSKMFRAAEGVSEVGV